MAKLNIYVPDDLKARMDAVGDNVNWSEVARPAFQAAVANHEHRKGQNMTTAIERLRASKTELMKRDQSEGGNAGRSWAENDAPYEILARLWAVRDKYDDDPNGMLRRSVDPRDELDFGDWQGFVGFDGSETEVYVSAFISGALSFFGEVRDKI
jgi:hypothetical protein